MMIYQKWLRSIQKSSMYPQQIPLLRFLEPIENLLLTSERKWKKKADHLGGYVLMPYEKNKTAQQDKAQLEREKRKILDVNRWNHQLLEQTFNYGLKDITKLDDFNQVVDWENSSFQQERNY